MARTRRRNTQKSLEQIAAEKLAARMRDLHSVNVPPATALLKSGEEIEVIRAGDTRAPESPDGKGKVAHHDTARRLDAFEALRSSMCDLVGAYDAARRLEKDVLMSLGQHDHGRPGERVDCEQGAYSRVDAIVFASERVRWIKKSMPDRDIWLLYELIVPGKPGEQWRQTVARITGETNANAQGAVVRSACCNLRDAYAKLERKARVAA